MKDCSRDNRLRPSSPIVTRFASEYPYHYSICIDESKFRHPRDDLLYIIRKYINPEVSRSGIARLLKREGMARLEDVIPKAEGETISPGKTFKDYEPGFFHIDIKYLPQMLGESSRRYSFRGDRPRHALGVVHIDGDMLEASSVDF